MAGEKYCRLAVGGKRVYEGLPVGAHFQFVANGARANLVGRVITLSVVYAAYRAQRLAVEPAVANYAVEEWGGAGGYACRSRGAIHGEEWVCGSVVDEAFVKPGA